MMIRLSALMMMVTGTLLFVLAKTVPLMNFLSMDYIGICCFWGGAIILFFCFGLSQTGLQYDTTPPGTAIINYIRRDGIIAPLLGKRVFPGESFLDVPKLGIIEDLGTDTVFLWGRKKVRFGLENINYTPDPRYMNMCKELYELGFDDTDDLQNILNIPYMDNEREMEKKVFYLERMGHIYWNMTHREPRGGKKLVEIFKKPREKNVTFGPSRRKNFTKNETRAKTEPQVQKETITGPQHENIRDIIDRRLR